MTVPRNVLVAIDLGWMSEPTLLYGRTLARAFGGRLHLLHVIENTFLRAVAMDPNAIEASAVKQMDERLTDEDRRDLDALSVVRKSDRPAEEIVRYAREEGIDLIVLATHTGTNLGDLGSVAEQVIRTAPCPVLTLRQKEPNAPAPR